MQVRQPPSVAGYADPAGLVRQSFAHPRPKATSSTRCCFATVWQAGTEAGFATSATLSRGFV